MNDTSYCVEQVDLNEKEFIKKNAELAMERHKLALEEWNEGGIIEYWEDDDRNTCVKYESGNWWHYKDLDLSSPIWW